MDEEQIRILAYLKWEAAGKPDGRSKEFWQEAEKEIFKKQFEEVFWQFLRPIKINYPENLPEFNIELEIPPDGTTLPPIIFTTSLDYNSTEDVILVGNNKVWKTAKTTKFKKCLKSAIRRIKK